MTSGPTNAPITSEATRRGFTLLEVAVATALMAIVIGTAAAVMATVLRDNRRAQVHSEMMRDATFASSVLNSELRQAGLGVPPAFNNQCTPDGESIRQDCITGVGCQPSYGTTTDPDGGGPLTAPPLNFPTSVLVAAPTQVGILGDLPRADGQYSAYGPLHNRPTAQSVGTSAEWLMWHNENNGMCAPGNTCTLASFSTFFSNTVAAETCSTANPNARTCPWGMRRVIGGEHVQIVAGDFTWSHAKLEAGPVVADVGAGRLAVHLSTAFDINDPTSAAYIEDGSWANTLPTDGPGGIRGVGWVMTLDRVFFFHDAPTKTLRRVQCSGDPDPLHPNWPNAAAAAMPSIAALALTPAGAPAEQNTCVGPDVVARNVQSVTFSYFNATGGTPASLTGIVAPTCPGAVPPASGKNSVRRIDYVINFQKPIDTNVAHDVKHSIRGSVRLQNL